MNDQFLIRYKIGDSFFEKLAGSTKVKLFITSLALMMLTFDMRIILPFFILHLFIFLSVYKQDKALNFIIKFMLLMNLINVLLFYIANPLIGSELAGQTTILFKFTDFYVVTYETLFYFLTRIMKIIGTLIISLWFILSITPTQLASGLYSIGVPYRIGTMISLGLRYMPDVYRDFVAIKESMQMRGLELQPKKTSIWKRLKANTQILLPLILISLEQVEIISSAMDLRGYGQQKKRSYYADIEVGKNDQIVRGLIWTQGILFIFYSILRITGRVPGLWII